MLCSCWVPRCKSGVATVLSDWHTTRAFRLLSPTLVLRGIEIQSKAGSLIVYVSLNYFTDFFVSLFFSFCLHRGDPLAALKVEAALPTLLSLVTTKLTLA
jgi:hypothetical protein